MFIDHVIQISTESEELLFFVVEIMIPLATARGSVPNTMLVFGDRLKKMTS
jgi:hypothetical protein